MKNETSCILYSKFTFLSKLPTRPRKALTLPLTPLRWCARTQHCWVRQVLLTGNGEFEVNARCILDKFHSWEENNLAYPNFIPFKLGQLHRSRQCILITSAKWGISLQTWAHWVFLYFQSSMFSVPIV